jgi:beta-glucosidase
VKIFANYRLAYLAAILVAVCSHSAATAAPSPQGQSVPAAPWRASAKHTEPATEAFVADLLAQLSLEEKIGQMIQADIASITPAEAQAYKLGSILAGGGAAPGNQVRTAPQAWLNLTDEFYRASLRTGGSHQAIPVIFGIDAVHGNAKLVGATIFPHNVGLGATHDVELIRRIGQATGEEVAVAGIDWTFAPTVAVARDVRWGRSYESYSEDPALVAAYAPAVVEGLQGARGTPQFLAPGHTLSSVKHFLGDGGTRDGRDQGDTRVSETELATVHGAGYAPAIDAGAMIVMASYNSWNGTKMHGNRHLLTEVLKEQMGFDGFVVGDWNAHEQVPGCTKFDCAAAVLAGVDMLMAPDSWKPLYDNLLREARAGKIPTARIDDAVRRILRVKALAGLFKRPPPKERSDAGDFSRLGSPAHRALARLAVRESLVLLKNTRAVLPLKRTARVLVCGDLADDIAAQAGGWTIDWQGNHNKNADFPGATSIYAGIKAQLAHGGGSAVMQRDCRYRERPDVAVVVFGETPYAEFQGDRETLEFSAHDKHELQRLERLRAAGVATVSVFISGRPMWVNPHINASDAFLAAWLPGSEGAGVADVLFGSADGVAVDFTGRLSFSWPNTAQPVKFATDGGVTGAAYPRGFGLAYGDVDNAGRLPEAPEVPAEHLTPPGSLYRSAHPTAPWSAFLADDKAEVHLTTEQQLAPQGEVSAEVRPHGVQLRWGGAARGFFLISGRAADLRPAAARHESISMRYRLEAPADQPVLLALRCTESKCGTVQGAFLDVSSALSGAAGSEWRTLSVPLSCFGAAGADISAVEVPFALGTSGSLRLTIAEIALKPAKATAACP